MTDVPEVSIASQTTPGHTALTNTTGAVSAHDPAAISAAGRDAAVDAFTNQMVRSAADAGAGVIGIGAVTRTTDQTQGFPITYHTAGISYEIPLSGQ